METPESRRYFYLYRLYHLAQAGDRKALDELLLDPSWLIAKLTSIGDPRALIADYDRYGTGDVQKLIGRALRLTANIYGRDQRQLMPQLLGRLTGCKGFGTNAFLEAAQLQLPRPAILTQHPSLTPPGAETDRVEGLKGTPTAMCVLPDGRLATGLAEFAMYDLHGLILFDAAESIQIWDPETGSLAAPLRRQYDRVLHWLKIVG